MMARVQIALSPEEHRRARGRAAELGISFAEYIRRLVSRDLGEPSQLVGPEGLFDLGDSGGSDVARDKDAMIGEAFGARR